MKVSIDKHVFQKPLEQADKFVPAKSTIPILSELLIEANEEGLFITGGDSHQFLKTKIDIDDLQVIEPGRITLSSKKIVEIVKKMKGVIDIESSDNTVFVSNGKKKYEMESLDPEEYPHFKEANGEDAIKIDGRSFLDLIRETAYSAHDKEDNVILTGLSLNINNNLMNLTGTNRHRLSSSVRTIESDRELTTIISARTLSELAKLISTEDKLDITVQETEFFVKKEGLTFYSRVLEGMYPNLDRIVPSTLTTAIKVKKDDLIEALEGVFIIVSDGAQKLIKMVVTDKIELKSVAQGVGKASETIDYSEIRGEGFKVSFNGKYVLDAVRSINSNEVLIGYTGIVSPIIFRDTNDERNYRIVLPFRTAED